MSWLKQVAGVNSEERVGFKSPIVMAVVGLIVLYFFGIARKHDARLVLAVELAQPKGLLLDDQASLELLESPRLATLVHALVELLGAFGPHAQPLDVGHAVAVSVVEGGVGDQQVVHRAVLGHAVAPEYRRGGRADQWRHGRYGPFQSRSWRP